MGMQNLLPEAIFLVWILGIITICVQSIMDGHLFGAGALQNYIVVLIKIGTFLFIVGNWQEIAIDVIFKSFEVAGLTAGNIATPVDPSTIFMSGFIMVQDVIAGVFGRSGWQVVLGTLPLLLLQQSICLVIILAFGYMAIMFFVANLEFYVCASLSIILVPFGMIPFFRSLFDTVVAGLFRNGVKYMTMLFVLGIGQNFFQASNTALAADSAWQYLLKAAVGVVMYAFIVSRIPTYVSAMIQGSPSSDSGTGMVTGAAGSAARLLIRK